MAKTEAQVLEEVGKLVGGARVPLSLQLNRLGEVVGLTFESTWKEGGTTPVEDNEGNVVEYKENYKEKSLTKEQIKALTDYSKSLGGDE